MDIEIIYEKTKEITDKVDEKNHEPSVIMDKMNK